MRSLGRSFFTVVAGAITLTIANGCREENTFVPPPPPKVTVAQPLQQDIVTFMEFVGRTEPFASVEIRARVRGFLKSVEFKEGTQVEAGDLLYTIDPAEYDATLKAAQARKADAVAELKRSKAELDRMERLRKQDAAAEMEFINAQVAVDRAEAAILSADAAIAQADLDLGYTRITAPMAGRVNKSAVDIGNLVGQGEPTLLTTIVPWNPIDVFFNINERRVALRRRSIETEKKHIDIEAFITLTDGSEYPLAGKINYADNRVDPQTGTIRIRAVFENPEGLLVPGVFVTVRVPTEQKEAILVPEEALQRDLSGYYLLTIDAQDKVDRRNVAPDTNVGSYKIISAGLDGNERVIVRGLQRARAGIVVQPEVVELPPAIQQTAATQPATKPS